MFFICVSALSMQAQKRYVVAFDCTKSMNHPDGDYTDKGLDDSKLWKPAKDCIHSLWTQASPVDEFVILLFQNSVLEIVRGYKGTQLNDWNRIESRMNDYCQHTLNELDAVRAEISQANSMIHAREAGVYRPAPYFICLNAESKVDDLERNLRAAHKNLDTELTDCVHIPSDSKQEVLDD